MTANGISASPSIEGVGIRRNLLEDLALKSLYLIGENKMKKHLDVEMEFVNRS